MRINKKFVYAWIFLNEDGPAGNCSSHTIHISDSSHLGKVTNQGYIYFVIKDVRENNPNIKIAVTLNWRDKNLLSNIFLHFNFSPQQNATNFAANLRAYLKNYDLDDFVTSTGNNLFLNIPPANSSVYY